MERPSLPETDDPKSARDRGRLASVADMKAVVDETCRRKEYDLIYERYALFSDVGMHVAHTHGLPFILEVNAPLIAERQRVEALPLAPLARDVEFRVFRGADAVLAVSEVMAAYTVRAGAASDRVHVLPNGVDTTCFHPGVFPHALPSRPAMSAAFVVGFTGSLKPWHGVNLLLDAFARVAAPSWTLLVVGDGPERGRLEEQAGALGILGRTVFTGAVPHDQVPEYVAAMDIAVAPYRATSDFYFSPLKLYEYLAAGRVVVASEIGQIAKVIRHGHNGYLVEPDNVAALSRALWILARDPKLRDVLASQAPVGLVTWEKVAQRVVTIAEAARRERALT